MTRPNPLDRRVYITINLGAGGRTLDMWQALRYIHEHADDPALVREFVEQFAWVVVGALAGRGAQINDIAAYIEAGGIRPEDEEEFEKALYGFIYRAQQ